jgi:hypothetical protein
VFTGRRSFDESLSAFHRARDEQVLPMYEFTTDLARLAPPPPEMQQLLGSIAGNQPAMDDFVSVVAGTLSPVEFFGAAAAA